MIILSVDTSAKVSSVSVVNEDRILVEFNIDTRLTHSQTLMPMLNAVLECSNLTFDDIDYFAVANGPGSFTGLRIGIAAIKGLAFACNKQCIPVSTLKGLAYNLRDLDTIICATMDARCNQVYYALFDFQKKSLIRLCDDKADSIDNLIEHLSSYNKKIIFVGDGAELCYNKAKDILQNVSIASIERRYQKASSVGFAAFDDFEGHKQDASELMPAYLRLPQAERERLNKIDR